MAVTIDSLEPELVQIIVEYANGSSPNTTKSIALANKYLYTATKAIVHRHTTVHHDSLARNVEFAKTVEALLNDELALRSIHHLTIGGGYANFSPSLSEFEELWQPLVRLIQKIGKLRTLTWNPTSAFPSNVLKALHEHQPQAKLRIFHYQRFYPALEYLDASESALSRSPALSHFRAKCEIENFAGWDYRISALKHMLVTVPNLQYVGIVAHDFEPPLDDTQEYGEGPLIGGVCGKPSSSVRSLTLDGGNLTFSKATLDTWKKVFDVSKLESLKFSRGFPTVDYFEVAPKMLPNLKSVSLNFGTVIGSSTGPNPNTTLQAANAYLRNCPPLETLSLWSWLRVVTLSELLDQHAVSLKSLQLHEKEGPGSLNADVPNTRTTISVNDLEAIRTRCKRLTELTFDLNREDKDFQLPLEKENLEYFNELSAFGTRLQRTQIYFDSYGLHELFFAGANLNYEGVEGEGQESTGDHEDGNDSTEQNDEVQENDGSHRRDCHFSPPRKKTRTETARDMPEDLMKCYVKEVWKTIYGQRNIGARKLDIKFGEWESLSRHTWRDTRRFFKVRPHERDDRVGECFVRMEVKKER